jgi:hypothetical protein
LCGRLSAAGCFIDTDATGAFRGFSAVGANAVAFVDKVVAVYASRLIFSAHSLCLCHNNLQGNGEFKVSQKATLHGVAHNSSGGFVCYWK